MPASSSSLWKSLFVLIAVGAFPLAGPAQTVSVLHRFSDTKIPNDGSSPYGGLVLAADGNFYGTTNYGGAGGGGTVYKVSPAGETTIVHCFGDGSVPQDGAEPQTGLFEGDDGNFYGTTSAGGAKGDGIVYQLTPAGVLTVLHSFGSIKGDGQSPTSVIQGGDGNLYGTTSWGGTKNGGSVFKITPTGVYSILHSFGSGKDGVSPQTGLVEGPDGAFYGTTYYGGLTGDGTAYKITAAGKLTVLHHFSVESPEGFQPSGLTLGMDGNLYGIVRYGIFHDGTVYKMTPEGVFTVLASFDDFSPRGGTPTATLCQGRDGNFYGSTDKTIFQMTPAGVMTTLRHAGGISTLVEGIDGIFYGTTNTEGTYGDPGTVFRVTSTGLYTKLHSFRQLEVANDGARPVGTLVEGKDGYLYGATTFGGSTADHNFVSTGYGTLFRLSRTGRVKILHSFADDLSNSLSVTKDGYRPINGLIQGSDGNFYGTTPASTFEGKEGTAFRLTPDGVCTILHRFGKSNLPHDGLNPQSGLMEGRNGRFYGTTNQGGAYSSGTIFRMTAEGGVTILHSFKGGGKDGLYPQTTLTEGTDGNFYGVTGSGGSRSNGTLFKMTPEGRVTILHNFTDGTTPMDGGVPSSNLTLGADGNFYGTTRFGGASGLGQGVVFKATPDGVVTVLHQFADGSVKNDGASPSGNLAAAADGGFYGTTASGGFESRGIVYYVSPKGDYKVIHRFGIGVDVDGDTTPTGVLRVGNILYVMTNYGGTTLEGAIFKIEL